MSVLERSRGTVIDRLRVRGSEMEALAVQLRMSALLSSMQLRPRTLAPSAILCIRELRDPAPGLLSLKGGAANRSERWEQALSASLEELARAAARPVLGPVPGSAGAVVFADLAEMLACLVIDCCRGDASVHWWWQGMFGGRSAYDALLPAWHDNPAAVPAALGHLSTRGYLLQFAGSVPETSVRSLLVKLLSHFGLYDLSHALSAIIDGTRSNAEDAAYLNTPVYSSSGAFGLSGAKPEMLAPWLPYAPESAIHGKGSMLEALFGVGLTLHRSPTVVRLPEFARTAELWASAKVIDMAIIAPDYLPSTLKPPFADSMDATSSSQDNQRTLDKQIVQQGNGVSPAHASVGHSPGIPGHVEPTESEVPVPPYEGHVSQEVQARHETQPKGVTETITPEAAVDAMEIGQDLAGETWPWEVGAEDNPERLSAPVEARIETELGGLFYLLNLALFLELYGDFAAPAHPDLSLSPWDLLALLGERYVGDEYVGDPVWNLLAALAGRTQEAQPGFYFHAPGEWRVPPEWLLPFGRAQSWVWSARGGRLQARHPEGFDVLDVRRNSERPGVQMLAETSGYRDRTDLTIKRRALPRAKRMSGLERWVGWLEEYTRARLARALGPVEGGDVARFVLMQRARVETTATHLHVMMSLAQLPLQIRIAGLDRDIGWMPAAGKSILFHFE